MSSEGFVSRNVSAFSRALESVLITENICRGLGLLQSLDSRVKLVTLILFIVIIGLANNLAVLAIIFGLILIFTLLSKISLGFFLKRVLLFIPVFTLVIAIPALFITPGSPLLTIGNKVIITIQAARTASLLFLRVTDSLSFGVLLILTTPWTKILMALRWFHLPAIIVDILGMTYRYIFLLLHTTNTMFLARRSRTVNSHSGSEKWLWLSRTLTTTLSKSQHLSEEVYLAMLSRGYRGDMRFLFDFRLNRRDYLWMAFVLVAAAILLWSNYIWIQ
jgi:cobalt/nickel transport system permease protein